MPGRMRRPLSCGAEQQHRFLGGGFHINPAASDRLLTVGGFDGFPVGCETTTTGADDPYGPHYRVGFHSRPAVGYFGYQFGWAHPRFRIVSIRFQNVEDEAGDVGVFPDEPSVTFAAMPPHCSLRRFRNPVGAVRADHVRFQSRPYSSAIPSLQNRSIHSSAPGGSWAARSERFAQNVPCGRWSMFRASRSQPGRSVSIW